MRPRLVLPIVLLFAACSGTPVPTGAARPNILLCIADDWSYPHASIHGTAVLQTPTFDAVSRRGLRFEQCFAAAPSCTPSRAGLLSGQECIRLDQGATLWGYLPARVPVYPELLEQAGYRVGYCRKGWGPGRIEPAGRQRNPAGEQYRDFKSFLAEQPAGQPFCFWFGSSDPHRPYRARDQLDAGMDLDAVEVPGFLPNSPAVRQDIARYYGEVQRFDREVGGLLQRLRDRGLLDNTLVIITSDNGMPFPRAKANIYDAGSRVPMALQWPAGLRKRGRHRGLVSHTDLAPTILAACGVAVPAEMTGQSLLPLLRGGAGPARQELFLCRERHAYVRPGNLGYPMRGLRSDRHLFIQNLFPDRWPAGDPELVRSVGPFGDCDNSPTKREMLANSGSPLTGLAFNKRPGEELYDLAADPWQLRNLAQLPEHQALVKELRGRLRARMRALHDPRALGKGARFDKNPYYGGGVRR